jgi:hypothetical protein
MTAMHRHRHDPGNSKRDPRVATEGAGERGDGEQE